MKDDIKEILEYIQKYTDEYETTNLTEIRALQMGYVDTVLLLDYITNLQEENERLKELCDKYEEEHNTAFKLWTTKMEKIPTYEEKKELQDRIDKAIEFAKQNIRIDDEYPDYMEMLYNDYQKLLNILQGSDE